MRVSDIIMFREFILFKDDLGGFVSLIRNWQEHKYLIKGERKKLVCSVIGAQSAEPGLLCVLT